MILSNSRRFVFFAVPKTATHTIREALRPCLDETDWEQQVLFGNQLSPISALARIGHGHISYRQLRATLGEEALRGFFKFAFVRNPYDRFISVCAFLNRGNGQFRKDPTLWMKSALLRPQFRARVLVRPQSDLLTDEEGKLQMDFVGRYESLARDFARLTDQLSIPGVQLTHLNASEHEDYNQVLDTDLRERIRQMYVRDFELFGY